MAFLGSTFRLAPPGGAKFRSLSRFFVLLILIVSFSALDPGRAQENSKEYQLKAVFLFDFAQFVKWPPNCFPNADAPFCIGILGDDPFGSTLEETLQGETINNHKLRIVRGRTFEDLRDCQLIFISKSEENHVAEIFSQLDSKPILTVSEINSFAQNGGIIDFYLQGNKVRFEINPDSAQRRGLKISSQLLNLGKIVTSNN